MKTFNRFLTLVLAVALVLSLGIVAGAAEPKAITGSITIQDSSTVSVAGKTFNAYKILDATFAGTAPNSEIAAYTVPEKLAGFFETRYTLDKSKPEFNRRVAEEIKKETDFFAFANAVLAEAKRVGIQPGTVKAGDSATSVEIKNLPIGYYVVEDAGKATPISAVMLQNVKTAVVTIKADKPSLDKKIDGTKDTDPSKTEPVEANNAAIGDKVPFVLTSKVPDMIGYSKYFFVVNDTLSAGLTFNKDVKVLINGEDKTANCTVTESNGALEIVFNDFIQYKSLKGKDIVITYSATVNKDAVIGNVGNPNTAKLIYSNNPNVTANGENKPDDSEKDKVTGVTPDVQTKTFVTELQLQKQDDSGKTLAGAEFEIAGDRLNTVLLTGTRFVEDTGGSFYKLNNGRFTDTVPNKDNKDLYASTEIKYAKTSYTKEKITKDQLNYTAYVDADGKLNITGLAAGTYTITELTAPDGYNKLEAPIKVDVTCEVPTNITGDCTWRVTVDGAAVNSDDGIVHVNVINTPGSLLPETGGVGTTIFYMAGGILMMAALVLFITKKRMTAEN